MKGLTVRDLRALKGIRQICFVQMTPEEQALAAAQAGMDMMGTAFRPENRLRGWPFLLSARTNKFP